MSYPSAFRGTTTESVHRAMNERVEKRTARVPGASMRSECECHRVECASSFQITIDDYETVRASGRRFVVAPGHEGRGDSIFSTARRYVVIEKSGLQAHSAEALDPR